MLFLSLIKPNVYKQKNLIGFEFFLTNSSNDLGVLINDGDCLLKSFQPCIFPDFNAINVQKGLMFSQKGQNDSVPCRCRHQFLLHNHKLLQCHYTSLLWFHSNHSHRQHSLGSPCSPRHTWNSLALQIQFCTGIDLSTHRTGDWLNQHCYSCKP